jgi:transcriptional regulator with XRE-family HTH domain
MSTRGADAIAGRATAKNERLKRSPLESRLIQQIIEVWIVIPEPKRTLTELADRLGVDKGYVSREARKRTAKVVAGPPLTRMLKDALDELDRYRDALERSRAQRAEWERQQREQRQAELEARRRAQVERQAAGDGPRSMTEDESTAEYWRIMREEQRKHPYGTGGRRRRTFSSVSPRLRPTPHADPWDDWKL